MSFSDAAQIPRCEALWQAVMQQMQADLWRFSKKSRQVKAKRDAIYWFTYCAKDVQIVCDYAGMSYVDEMRRFKKWQARQTATEPIIFALPPLATPQQASFLPALLHGFTPLQFCIIKRKRNRIQFVTNCHQLELWG